MFIRTAVLIAALATAAHAEGKPWATVGDWAIAYAANNHACVATRPYPGGVRFFIGYAIDGQNLYLGLQLFEPSWTSIRNGQDYPAMVRFGTAAPRTLHMRGSVRNEGPSLVFAVDAMSADADSFLADFAEAATMMWVYDGKSSGLLPLGEAGAAFDEATKCTQHYQDRGVTAGGTAPAQ